MDQTPEDHEPRSAEATEDVDMISLPDAGDKETQASDQSSSPAQDQKEAQGEPSLPTASPTTVPFAAPPIEVQIMMIEDLVKPFNTGELEEKSAAYLVSRRWLAPAQALGSGDTAKAAKLLPHGSLGPVDNADLIDGVIQDIEGNPAVRLKPGISQEDFEYFPKEAWDLIISWYGLAVGQMPIVRYTHNTSPNSMIPNVQYELHPPVFTLHRLWSPISGIAHDKEIPGENLPAPVIMCTSSYNVQAFLKRAKTLLHIPITRSVRMWRVPRKLAAGHATSLSPASLPAKTTSMLSLTTPPDSPKLEAAQSLSNPQDAWSKLLLEVADFMTLQNTSEREQLSQIKDLTHDANYNGSRTLAFVSLVVDQTIVLDENVERNFWVSTYQPKKSKADQLSGRAAALPSTASTSSLAPTANTAAARTNAATSTAASSGRSSPRNAGLLTRGRAKQKSGRTLGCVGLSNLGNTCYMNSALQCVRSVEEMTKYFLVHENEQEVNHSNPLGHGGNVANAYGYLLDDIFKGVSSSIVPRQFKNTIGRYAPAFSGYGQQDSQEFLGFLLDGLQEDLSRVKKKPYIPKPDSTDEMISNPAAIREMAEQVWDITKRRDDSVIADLFTGMYKSTLVCPVCQKISITFDPFTNLTLPLPIQSIWAKMVRFVPLNDHPVNLEVELDKTSSIQALKDFVGVRVGVPSERLVCAEELRDSINTVHDDLKTVSEEIRANDTIVLFEVEAAPTNSMSKSMPRKKIRSMLDINEEPEIPEWDSPLAERLLVPVLHRFDPDAHRSRFGSRSCLPPHFIVLNRKEAMDEEVIRRKILEKVASFSTWSGFAEVEAGVPSEPQSTSNHDGSDSRKDDHEPIVSNDSDVGSAGDGKVVAKSVEGEDDLVDVAMNDAIDTTPQMMSGSEPKILYNFNRQRPKWVADSNVYIRGEMQQLFDMSYFSDGNNIIPVLWTPARDDNKYPKLRTRVPQPPVLTLPGDREMGSPGNWESVGGSGSDNDNESSQDARVKSEMTRMADESEEEDNVLPAAQNIAHRHTAGLVVGGRRRAVKHHKMYGSKGARRRQRQSHGQGSRHEQEDDDDRKIEVEHDDKVSQKTAVTASDGGPLVRLGEGIIVDWNPEAWDLVFGKESPDDTMRGEATFQNPLPVIDDPELHEKRRNRQARRKRGLTLDECLDEFEREEILSENDTWYCPRCKEHRRASKKFDLWKTPDILVVHLKRFSSSGWRRDKLDTRVDFPVEGLDLTKRVLDRQTGKQEIYDLIAVDDHWGGLGGGHYTAFAQNFVDHQWYEYNDSSVSKVTDTSRVVSSAAYLLFYRRRSDIPLGGARFQEIEEKFKRMAESESDDSAQESGEDQRLGTGSSFIGSPSALKGAGAGAGAGLRRRASPGSANNGASSRTLRANGGGVGDAKAGNEELPPYGPSIDNVLGTLGGPADSSDEYDEVADGSGEMPMRIAGTSILNFGESSSLNEGDNLIQKSMEVDDDTYVSNTNDSGGGSTSMYWTQPWSFGTIDGEGNVGEGIRQNSPGSDVANAGGSELGDADTAVATAHGSDEMSLGTPDEKEAAPIFVQTEIEDIQRQAWAQKEGVAAQRVHAVTLAQEEDMASEKAVDIHVGDGDADKE